MNNSIQEEKIMKSYQKIQYFYSKLKLRMYMLSIYFKELIKYYEQYKKNITNNILNDTNLNKLLNQSIAVYSLNNKHYIKKEKKFIKITNEEYYNLCTYKFILQYLYKYDNTLRVCIKKIQEYFLNIINIQKNIVQTYSFSLELLYSNGMVKNQVFIDNLQEILNYDELINK